MEHKKEELLDYAESRCKTIMIAGLQEFENGFGFIWGHGKPWASLTDEQKEMREVWKEVRQEILGGGQFRIDQLRDRFRLYDIKKKERIVFYPQDRSYDYDKDPR